MSEKFISEPKTPEEWLIESHREKFRRRFLWIMQARRTLYDTVIQQIGERKGVVSLFDFFTSDDLDAPKYAGMLGVSLDTLTAIEYVSEEALLASGTLKN